MRGRRFLLVLVAASILVAASVTWNAETPLSAASDPGLAAPQMEDGRCSPPPQCWRDRDCDPICGKRNGQCIQVNSCYRECACFS